MAEQHGHPAAEPEPRGGAAVQRRLSRLPVLRGPSEEGAGGVGDDGQVPGGGGEVREAVRQPGGGGRGGVRVRVCRPPGAGVPGQGRDSLLEQRELRLSVPGGGGETEVCGDCGQSVGPFLLLLSLSPQSPDLQPGPQAGPPHLLLSARPPGGAGRLQGQSAQGGQAQSGLLQSPRILSLPLDRDHPHRQPRIHCGHSGNSMRGFPQEDSPPPDSAEQHPDLSRERLPQPVLPLPRVPGAHSWSDNYQQGGRPSASPRSGQTG